MGTYEIHARRHERDSDLDERREDVFGQAIDEIHKALDKLIESGGTFRLTNCFCYGTKQTGHVGANVAADLCQRENAFNNNVPTNKNKSAAR